MPRFALYSTCALFALAGPSWLGQVGVAEAAFRPMGIDCHEMTTGLAVDGDSESLPEPTTPPPVERLLAKALHIPGSGGAGSTGSVANAAAGHGPGIVPEVLLPDPAPGARLWLAHERPAVAAHLSSVFEPPRPETSC